MEIIVLLSIGFMGLALIGTTGDDFGDDASSDPEQLPPEDDAFELLQEDETEDLTTELPAETSVDDTVDDDVLEPIPEPLPPEEETEYQPDSYLYTSQTAVGTSGDDFVRFIGDGVFQVELAAGDDEAIIYGGAAYVYGGDGDDHIRSDSANTDHSEFFGGGGDDTIDASQMNNFDIFGGEGNDIIMTSELANGGSGYWAQADGGEGDDRLIHDASTNYQGRASLYLTGGEGNDSFEISFSEASEYDDNSDETSTVPIVSRLVSIVDFEVGVDQLQINVMISDNDYTVASAQLEENADTGRTTLTVTYDHPTNTSREMVIALKGTNIPWDDITFVGDNIPPVLIPA